MPNVQLLFFLAWVPKNSAQQWSASRRDGCHLQTEVEDDSSILLFSPWLTGCKASAEEMKAPEDGRATSGKEPGSLNEGVDPKRPMANCDKCDKSTCVVSEPLKCSAFCYCGPHVLLQLMPAINHT